MGELRALHWRDVDFRRSVVRVRASYAAGELSVPKSGKVRSVPMVDDVARLLAQLNARQDFTGDDDLVFCEPDGGWPNDDRLRRRYEAALKRAGLRRLMPAPQVGRILPSVGDAFVTEEKWLRLRARRRRAWHRLLRTRSASGCPGGIGLVWLELLETLDC